jgi:diguanylate cyclase (GGDEF)-like protein
MREVDALRSLVEFDTTLLDERRQLAVDELATYQIASASDFAAAGVDPVPAATARHATDAALRRVPFLLRTVSPGDLAHARDQVDQGKVLASWSVAFDNLSQSAFTAADRQLDAVRETTRSVHGSLALQDAIDTLDDAINVANGTMLEVRDFGRYLWAPAGKESAYLATLARSNAELDAREHALAITPVERVQRAYLGAKSGASAYDTAVWNALRGEHASTLLESGMATELVQGAQRTGKMSAVPVVALNAVRSAAAATYAEARADARRVVFFGAGALLVSLAVALVAARTIAAPVRRLTAQARRVGRGELDVEPLPASGPPEVAHAASAFNDVVANLRLLEAKAAALAECNLTHPALATPLPGELGQALQRSVEVFSGSLSEQQRLQDRLTQQATHDPLTGLVNRSAAIDAVARGVARSRRTGATIAAIAIDLDDFKRINDFHGHGVGDGVLQKVARRLERAARYGDVVARLGGDEFLLVAENLDGTNDAIALAQRALESVCEPIVVDGHQLVLDASAGIAIDADHHDDARDLLAKAGLAVHRAKQHSESAVELYDPGLQQEFVHRADVEHALAATLARGGDELRLCYQPIIDGNYHELIGVEALVRWDRPGHGTVAPDAFIPVAEMSNLIVDLDRWVLHHATAQLAAWSDQPDLRGITVAVNVSGRHVLHADLTANVRSALDESGLDPRRLIVEVTETVLVDDLHRAGQQLQALRDFGVRVAVDDFGTGYTSLAHLRALPIDEIKIDRSFVSQLDGAQERSLVQMVNELAHHLGVPTVAEGVEEEQHASDLAQLGCDALQGYYFSRPLDPDALAAWSKQRSAPAA